MEKINFQDLPSTETPINASILNKIQDNMEKVGVVVSSTQPTTNEKVWIQCSGNLFNKNNYNLYKGYIDSSTLQWIQNDNGNFIYLKVKPNTTYTVTRNIVASQFAVATGIDVPNAGQTATSFKNGEGQDSVTIKTGPNDNYLYIYVLWNDGATVTINEVIESLQVSSGKVIYIRNDNDVYEEIYNENKVAKNTYSTEEVVIGTWFGKPLYRKCFTGFFTDKLTTIYLGGNFNVTRWDGFISYTSENLLLPINYGNNSLPIAAYISGVGSSNCALNIQIDVGSLNGLEYVVTAEYTKTTD